MPRAATPAATFTAHGSAQHRLYLQDTVQYCTCCNVLLVAVADKASLLPSEPVLHALHALVAIMSKFGALIMGPAGAGKSTFCAALLEHLQTTRRGSYYINLDPAADTFVHEPDLDIKDLISLDDVMEELHLGPNGGLIYCFEFLLENLDFLTEKLETVTEEYLIIIDMPGQIELYTHIPILPNLVRHLTRGSLNINLCAAYLLESTFIVDRAKFFAGTLSAMSAMLMLEIPHVNVLSKMDLIKGSVRRRELRRFIDADVGLLDDDPAVEDQEDEHLMDDASRDPDDPAAIQSIMAGKSFNKLNRSVAKLIDDFGMVSFLQLNAQDEDSVAAVLSYIDEAIQFHEAQEPREPMDEVNYEMME
jgi:GPN-loop GTPase